MKTKEELRRKILECSYIDEIMQVISDYEASMGHYKISPLKDKPGFYAVDEPDFNVVMAVFKGEKEIAEGEWYLINAKEQEPEVKEYGWNTLDNLPKEPIKCYIGLGFGYTELAYWDGDSWYLRPDSRIGIKYIEKWKPAK